MPNTALIAKVNQNLAAIEQQLQPNCQLIVVSKYREIEEIEAVIARGNTFFAENRVQALLERYEALPKHLEWHLIGHLQTNKVKYIAPFIAMIHSVDSEKLLQTIQKEAEKNDRIIPVLIQIHVAEEETKFGFSPEEALAFFEQLDPALYPNVEISGLMAMASFTESEQQIKQEFGIVQQLFQRVQQEYTQKLPHFQELSIGMSGDYILAQEFGSTMVRVGSAVFR
ncbi:MAG: YggS family pyridoxal phosphate-dependent enzyme [Bacteroidota bacterium]